MVGLSAWRAAQALALTVSYVPYSLGCGLAHTHSTQSHTPFTHFHRPYIQAGARQGESRRRRQKRAAPGP